MLNHFLQFYYQLLIPVTQQDISEPHVRKIRVVDEDRDGSQDVGLFALHPADMVFSLTEFCCVQLHETSVCKTLLWPSGNT